MKIQANDIKLLIDQEGRAEVVFALASPPYEVKGWLRKLKEILSKGKQLDVEIKQHREARSLDANAYLWVLISKIADALRLSKEDVYLQALCDYGQSQIISVLSDCPVGGYLKYYDVFGTGTVNGKEFTHYKVYKGSSEYDTREMSILIDGVVNECKDLDIETMTPEQLTAMKESWCKSEKTA